MIYPIVKYGDPVLEREADTVTEFDTPELHKFLEDMFESMYAAKGVGLAAPQIGVSQEDRGDRHLQRRESGGEARADQSRRSCKIEGKQEGEEGCLSIPGFREQVRRAQARHRARAERQGRGVRDDRRGSAGARLSARDRSPERQALHHATSAR